MGRLPVVAGAGRCHFVHVNEEVVDRTEKQKRRMF